MKTTFYSNVPEINALVPQLIQAFAAVVSKEEASPRLLLISPNGTTYAVKVDNAGTLTTTVVDGSSRI